MFPFSFQEYCQYYNKTSDIDRLFDEYTIKGGLSGSYVYRKERDRANYTQEVYETIVTRDLVQKYSLPDTPVLQRLSEFLVDHISNLQRTMLRWKSISSICVMPLSFMKRRDKNDTLSIDGTSAGFSQPPKGILFLSKHAIRDQGVETEAVKDDF